MTIIDARTTYRNYPKPATGNDISDDFPRLITAFDAIDADVAAILTAVAGKAPIVHTHVIADVSGLQAALDAKLSTSASFTLAGLTDVSGASGATNGQVLKRVGAVWQPGSVNYSEIIGAPASNAVFGAAGTAHSLGLVPDPGATAGSVRVLRENASWSAISSSDITTALAGSLTGSGSFVLASSPTLTSPNLGTPSAANLTNATGLPLTTGVTGVLPVANGGTGTGTATGTGNVVLANSPALTGNPTAPTQGTSDNSANIATTGFVKAQGYATYASLGSAAGLNVGTGAGNVVQLDGSAKLPAVDGSQLTNLPASPVVTARQCAMSGPITSGAASFLPATSGSLSISTQNVSSGTPLIVTAAIGFNAKGNVDAIGSATTNLVWSGLTASTTNYLGVTVAGGSLTTMSTTIAPIYQTGGAVSTSNGQYTFDVLQQKMFVGNGTTASAVNVVFIAECATNGAGVTGVTMYPYSLPGGKTGGAVPNNIGFGQSWQDVTSARSLNVAYYNTTGRPIEVSVALTVSTTSNVFGYVYGNQVTAPIAVPGGSDTTFSFIVPPGASYSVNGNFASARSWMELR